MTQQSGGGINSSELRTSGFKLKEVFPPALETDPHGDCGHEEWDCEVLRYGP